MDWPADSRIPAGKRVIACFLAGVPLALAGLWWLLARNPAPPTWQSRVETHIAEVRQGGGVPEGTLPRMAAGISEVEETIGARVVWTDADRTRLRELVELGLSRTPGELAAADGQSDAWQDQVVMSAAFRVIADRMIRRQPMPQDFVDWFRGRAIALTQDPVASRRSVGIAALRDAGLLTYPDALAAMEAVAADARESTAQGAAILSLRRFREQMDEYLAISAERGY